jgi:glycosyltransferase involved in cell wall biosynthesis
MRGIDPSTGMAPGLLVVCPVQTAGPIPIAFVITSFDPGGTERQTIELIRRLDRRRWTIHLACTRREGAWYRRAADAVASVTEFPVRSLRGTQAASHAWRFAHWCRARQVAVVQTAGLPSNILGLPGAALAHVPVRIGSRREINPDKTLPAIAAQRAAYAFAHKVVANSRAAATRLRFECIPRRKIAVIPNGLELGPFTPRAPRSILRHVVMVANLRPEKGHDVLIDAAGDVLRRFPDARFELVGAGPERSRLLARVQSSRLADAFSFVGHDENVAARLAAADIFVLPSRSEAFPNAVLEAMAAGLPIVASAIGGIPELVEDGRTGLLVPPGRPDLLARRLSELMADPALAGRLGRAAGNEARTHYSFDRMVDAFDSLYRAELARRRVIPAHAAPAPVS